MKGKRNGVDVIVYVHIQVRDCSKYGHKEPEGGWGEWLFPAKPKCCAEPEQPDEPKSDKCISPRADWIDDFDSCVHGRGIPQ